tara:strand:- start:46 stop:228 length:183 start_codon:yes stop_codon:yes gene_type:complete
MEKNIFSIGEKVIYKDNSGNNFYAKIIDIHFDDIEPYYSIKIKGKKEEKQTVINKLQKIK